MSATWQTVRVFISSTFRDMHAERDHLVKVVFPALRERLEKYRVHLIDIDLRWGVTKEQADNDQALDVCLRQIDECRPFFVGLLGERYGWVPRRFPVEALKRYGWVQHHTGKSVTELEILHGVLNNPQMRGHGFFYFRDPAALRDVPPPVRETVFEESDPALKAKLRELKDAVRRSGYPVMEAYPAKWDPQAYDRPSRSHGRLVGLESFGERVRDQLWQAIQAELQLPDTPPTVTMAETDPLSEESDYHERFMESRLRVYVWREKIQEALMKFAEGDGTEPCLLTAPSGAGKSAALAKFVEVYRQKHPDALVVPHFIGASPRSTNLRETLRRFCLVLRKECATVFDQEKAARLAEVTGQDEAAAKKRQEIEQEYEVPQEINPLVFRFRTWLEKIPVSQRVLIVVDALNQLDETDRAQELFWLPWQLPKNVKMVVSCIEEQTATVSTTDYTDNTDRKSSVPSVSSVVKKSVLSSFQHRPHVRLRIEPLTDAERRDIIGEVPSLSAKALDAAQIQLLLNNPATTNPLFLLVALEELRGFGSYEQLNDRIRAFPREGDTVTAIFGQVIERLEEEFDPALVRRLLSFLACARIGLSEKELQELLSHQPSATSGQQSSKLLTLNSSLLTDFFPVLRQLRPYLQYRGELLDFYHRNLFKAVRARYLGEEQTRRTFHHELADYFRSKADPANDKQWKGESPRPFLEVVFHLAGARLDDELCGTLCDLRFVEARCRLSQVFELQSDYRLALEALPEAQAELGEERRRQERAAKWTREIIEYARQWNDRRDRLARGEKVAEPEPTLPEMIPSMEPWSDERIEAECKRIIENPTRLDRLRAFAGFVESECYPLLRFGNREAFIIQHAFSHAAGGPIHESASRRVPHVNVPMLLRRWRPDALTNPKPALLRTLEAHNHAAISLSATPDKRRAISGGQDHNLRVWDLKTGVCLRTLEGHSSSVENVSVSADGRRAVSTSLDGTLRVWDLEGGVCLRTITDPSREDRSASVRDISVMADGRRAVLGSLDNTLWVLDLESGICVRTCTSSSGWLFAMSATPDGRRAVSGGDDCILRVWDLESGQCERTLDGHGLHITSVSVTPDGRRVASASSDGILRIWDLESGACLRMINCHAAGVSNVTVTADGRLAVTGVGGRLLQVWNLENAVCLRTIEARTSIVSVSPDGRRAVSGDEHRLQVWDLESGLCLRTVQGSSENVSSVCLMPDGQRVVSGGSDKLLRVWDLASGQCLRTLEGNSEARELKVTPDGRRVVSASGHPGKTISVWDLERERCVRTLEGHCDWVRCLDLTPDGRNLVSGSNDKTLRVWNLESSECLRTIQGHNNYVDGVIVTPDGWRVLSHDDNTMCLWNLENGTCLWTVHDHKAIWIRVTPDGRCAVSNSMRVWDLESGRCLRKPVGHSHHGYSVNVTPDGRRAVLANGKEIRVLDLKSGKYLRTLEGHTCTVQSVSVTPDGRHAVSRSEDYTLRVWDLESGVCLVVFVAPDSVWHVAVSPSMASIVCVLEIGGVMFLESRGIEFGPVICTAAQPSASSVRPVVRCLCCGKEFAIPDLVANVIAAHIALLQPNQSPCLDLPDSAFDDPRLLGTCPHCAHALKFNPFFVEIPAR